MLLTITNDVAPGSLHAATDLGYLLHKNPTRAHELKLSFGTAHLFYTEATASRCTVCLLLDIDPISLVRGKGRQDSRDVPYVNDRPYVASSFLSTAISKTMGTAMSGRCKDRPELAELPLNLTVAIPVLPCRGGEVLLRRLFEPLDYDIEVTSAPLDERFLEWGQSPYLNLRLTKQTTVAELLSHLHVLIPVLDDDKHYWVAEGEVDNILRRGEGWLAGHPEHNLIMRRALKNKRDLYGPALERLAVVDDVLSNENDAMIESIESVSERPGSLNERRLQHVVKTLKEHAVHRVVDLGCGEGRLLRLLLDDQQFTQISGMDVSQSVLKRAARRLNLEKLPRLVRERLTLFQGSLVYRDQRLCGYDAATLIEVIEHLDAERLSTLEKIVFGFARPDVVIVTTPNIEYNVNYIGFAPGQFRHEDHRFEWTRAEFKDWATRIGTEYGFTFTHSAIGDEHESLGSPTQMVVFRKVNATEIKEVNP